MTQSEFGKRLGVSKNAISEIELGKASIGVNRLVEVCNVFDVTFLDVFKGTHLIEQKDTNDVNTMYNQLTSANKEIVKGILKVFLKSQKII